MRKETPIRVVICLLLLVVISWLCSCSVAVATADLATAPEEPAFGGVDFSYVETAVAMGRLHQIVKCDQTGVLYAVSESGTLTLLVNPDGTPMLWEN